MIRPNYAEIDLLNLTHNITSIKRSLIPGTKFLAVIKANAYGHGIVQISNAALRCGADYLGVAIPEEGKALREAGRCDLPVLYNVNFGHSQPCSVLPIGCRAKIDCARRTLHITEPCVED